MTETERRAAGAGRVPVRTLVEICGSDSAMPAFEAESLNLSGRGMRVVTAYLPDLGDKLVCRFGNRNEEVVVEGEVAWRTKIEDGGEFGIRFTALDSSSVQSLRKLCKLPEPRLTSAEPQQAGLDHGAKVRLHIEGLGAPMKARVRDGSLRKARVGSTLEFLKLGRQLQIEDLARGSRSAAQIDGVSIAIDPQTQIPELVVALRFDAADTTPEPSVIDTRRPDSPDRKANDAAKPAISQPARVESDAVEHDLEDGDEEADDELLDTQAWQARLHALAGNANRLARATGQLALRASGDATKRTGKLLGQVARHAASFKREREQQRPRRVTAPAPSAPLAAKGARLRPQHVQSRARPASMRGRRRLQLVLGAAGALGVLTSAVYIFTPDGTDQPAMMATASKAPQASVDVTDFDHEGNPKQPAQTALAKAATNTVTENEQGIVANVPLFGPTPMATMEPAPLLPNADEVDEEAREKAAAAAAVEDESWEEPEESSASAGSAKSQDLKPWGRGRLHLPTIHRIRLDEPGADIQGAIEPTGFTVIIPGRKAMESGKAIARRDQRIQSVTSSNTAAGAKVTFRFRNDVPPYRVRLRKDFVEFLISAPEEAR